MTEVERAQTQTTRPAERSDARPKPMGLVRPRLTDRLADPGSYSVGWVVAPAGSGKTRLLTHVADGYTGPVVWRATPEPTPRTEAALMQWLAGPELGPPVSDLEGFLDSVSGLDTPVLVVLDDIHLIEGSEAEGTLARLVAAVPSGLRLLLASRVSLAFDLSRLRVSGRLVEIGPDELRFRTWEVEDLFRDVYREPLLPEDVAALARRTAGWAAYLQLFHLATARKPYSERRRVLSNLATRSRLMQEYLTRHVLTGLSPELQEFLIRTSVLRRPTAELSDELLGWDGKSRALLQELERRQLFTEHAAGDDSYRYHSVLLSYLDARLLETVGIGKAREEHHRAAELLESAGWTAEALAAYAKSEDWEEVARMLGHPDGSSAVLGDAWLEALPPAVVTSDPLLLMARARRALARGAVADAIGLMRGAEEVAVSTSVAESCRSERERLAEWALPDRAAGADWSSLIRLATQRSPREAQQRAAALPGVASRFAEGMAAFAGGDMRAASRLLRVVATHPDAAQAMAAGALLAGSIAGALCSAPFSADEIDRLREEVEASGIPWLDRLARVVLLTAEPGRDRDIEQFRDACVRQADLWGAALIALFGGIGRLWDGQRATEEFERAVQAFADRSAPVCEHTALAYLAVAAYRDGQMERAGSAAQQAWARGSLAEAPFPVGLASLVLGTLRSDSKYLDRAREILEPLGVWDWHASLVGLGTDQVTERTATPPAVANGSGAVSSESGAGTPPSTRTEPADRAEQPERVDPPVVLRCLGSFQLVIDGRAVDDSTVKPMERTLLRLLATKAGRMVHREELTEALWPEADPDVGLHRLQVAISAVRRLLARDGAPSPSPGSGPGERPLLAREGDSYGLALPGDSDVDVWTFERALRRANEHRADRDRVGEQAALREAITSYTGPLLPGEGPADWVQADRRALESAAADGAVRLAGLRLEDGDAQGAAEAARQGLVIDRYRDELWKVLIDASEHSGHLAEAGRARQEYAEIIDEFRGAT